MQKTILYHFMSVAFFTTISAVFAAPFPITALPNSQAFTNCTPQFNITGDEINAITTKMSVADFTASLQQIARNDCSLLYKSPSEVQDPPRTIQLDLGSIAAGGAETSGAHITFDRGSFQSYLRDIPELMGMMAHEIAHVYQTGTGPHGFIEGMADYDQLHQNIDGDDMDFSERKRGGNWDDGYATSAFFIDYLNQRFQDAAYLINKNSRSGWAYMKTMTGEDVGTLWSEYQNWLANGTPPLTFSNSSTSSGSGSSSGGSSSSSSGSGSFGVDPGSTSGSSSGWGGGSSGGSRGGGGCHRHHHHHAKVSFFRNGFKIYRSRHFSKSDSGAQNLTALEKAIFEETNLLRSNPAAYVQYLTGKSDASEVIQVLMNTAPLPALTLSMGMSHASKDHSELMAKNNHLSHQEPGEPEFGTRLNKYGTWDGRIGENVEEGVQEARKVIILYLIDRGVPGRGHRKNLLNPDYKYTGIGCSGRFCTNDYAVMYREK